MLQSPFNHIFRECKGEGYTLLWTFLVEEIYDLERNLTTYRF